MATTEALLQQLIDLQREEMRRTRHYRITRIVLGMLPGFIFLLLTVWGSIVAYQSLAPVLENLPATLQEQGLSNFTPKF